MEDTVSVHLVPKGPGGDILPDPLPQLGPSSPHRLSPDSGRAAEAARVLLALGRGVTAAVTPGHSVRASLPRQVCESLFPGAISTGPAAPSPPRGGLPVPAALRDTIDFTYVPTPPCFLAAAREIAPGSRLHHLSLAEVVALLGAARCHRRGWTGRDVRVAMADTGFFDHPFFALNGYRMTRENAASSGAATDDLTGHGTGACANALAIAPDCLFVGVRMAPDTAASDALHVALAHRPQVLTLSWGWDIDGQSRESLKASSPNQYAEMRHVEQILAAAVAAGVTVVCAAGDGHKAFPGSLPWVISAGGTTALPDGSLKASGIASSYRSHLYPGRDVPDLCGLIGDAGMLGDILLPVPPGSPADGLNLFQGKGSGWSIFSGTSAAAPQVAGVAALLLQVNPELSPDEVKELLGTTARDVAAGRSALGDAAAAGPDLATGAGLVDALAACSSAAARSSSS